LRGWGCWGRAQAGAEIVEDGDFECPAGLGAAEPEVAGLAALFADGSAGDFALVTKARMSFSEALGVERDFRPFEPAQKVVFAAEPPPQPTIERRMAGSAPSFATLNQATPDSRSPPESRSRSFGITH
jgi:hypothetical protein